MRQSITTKKCLDILNDLLEAEEGAKITLCEGTKIKVERHRIRFSRALKVLPKPLLERISITRKRISENYFELFLEYTKNEAYGQFRLYQTEKVYFWNKPGFLEGETKNEKS